jgi:hypothetical protein
LEPTAGLGGSRQRNIHIHMLRPDKSSTKPQTFFLDARQIKRGREIDALHLGIVRKNSF